MTIHNSEMSPRSIARLGGVAYLCIILAGMFAEFFVRSSLIVPGDAAATTQNIMNAEGLYRAGFAADLVMLLCDAVVAVVFYMLLKPVNRNLAFLAAAFRLIHTAILGANLLNHVAPLLLFNGTIYPAAFSAAQLQALAMLFLEAHSFGYLIALVFFGIHCLILGYLLFKSDYFPSTLGILIAIAAVSYLAEGFTHFLIPQYGEVASAIVAITASIAELSLCLWLLIVGVKTPVARSAT